jgi:hypothetical protein
MSKQHNNIAVKKPDCYTEETFNAFLDHHNELKVYYMGIKGAAQRLFNHLVSQHGYSIEKANEIANGVE